MYSSESWHVYTLIYSLSYLWNGTFLNHKDSVMFIYSQSVFPVFRGLDNSFSFPVVLPFPECRVNTTVPVGSSAI